MKEKVMNGLEKFSKAMLSPLSYISAAGLILVLGALLTSTSLSAMIPVLQWTPIKLLGQLIYNCIMVIINNLSLMFCVGIAAALAKKNKQQAAIIGLMSYFMYLTAGNVTLTQLGMLAEADPMVGLYGTGQSTVFGIQTVDMGVFGAAVATGISQLVTCFSYFVHFFSKKCTFRLCKFRFDPHLYARILPIGLSDGVTELCTGLMIFLFNRTVLKCIGTDGVVTYTVIAYVTTIVINLMVGISQGSQPLASYHYGKEDHTGCQKLLRYALTTVCIFAPALFLLVFFFAPQIVRTYLSHAGDELIAYSIGAFRRYSVSYLLLGFNIVIGGFMTAIERPVPAICISVGRGLALQSAVLLLLAAIFGGDAVWYTPIFSEALCLVMSLLFLRSYRRQTDMQA